ncbi:SF2_C_SNF domain containing protein [Candidatus Nanopelagicaceae bacterium]
MAYPKVIDNRRSTLLSALADVAPKFDELAVATGYWDLKGMSALLPHLENYKKIRILIGQEPLRARFKDALKVQADGDFPEADLKWDLTNTDFESELVSAGVKVTDLIESGKLEVRIYRGAFLHAKAYIFTNSSGNDAVGIIGSSNFTLAGLTTNTELNSLEDENRIVKYKPENSTDTHGHLSWFNEIWNDEKSELWNGEFSQIIQESPLGVVCYSPYEMYMKTLWELYKDEVDISTEISEVTSSSLFAFQQRNARLLIQKLQKYGVAMLADSVGLGKTITAGAVIKEYIESYKARRIYIIVPASLVQSWKRDLAKVHGMTSGFEVISMQDFQGIERAREIDKYADVNLFVIDEAHNLRNPNGTRHEQLLDWFTNNSDSHVLLLTATPINNKLTDFVNQIQLAAKGRLSAFPVVYPTSKKREVIDFFEAVKRLTADMQAAENKGEKVDFKRVSRIMRQGLRHFLVRTTRRGIEAEYGGLLAEDGTLRKFPKSKVLNHPYAFSEALGKGIDHAISSESATFEGLDPRFIEVESLLNQTQRTKHPLDLVDQIGSAEQEQENAVFEKVFKLILLLGFAPYKTSTYLNRYYGKSSDEIKEFNISPEDSFRLRSQMSVHNIMRITFLKRLESSQAALSISLNQYLSRLNKFEKYLEDGHIASIKDINEIEKEFGDDLSNWTEESVRAELEIELIPADSNNYQIAQLKKDIKRDKAIIAVIQECCAVLNNEDDKLASLVDLINKVRKDGNSGKKFLLFSYFTDTIRYLEQKLPELINDEAFNLRSAFLSGSNRSELEDVVKRFSPNSTNSGVEPENEIDFLFSTDVLSEGQNLQDCGILINYDLHWNPVRMIQRNGRINRLGSPFENVQIYNLHPETSLDSYLKLVNRLERKIDAIKFTIGTDQSVLGEDENPIEFLDGFEEDEELKAVLSLYGSPDSNEILDNFDDDDELLSEDEFIIELRKFLSTSDEKTVERIKSIPKGKWGYLPKGTRAVKGQALALTEISGFVEGTGKEFTSHFFIESDPSDGYMVGPIDMIEALGQIKSSADDSEKRTDSIQLNRKLVKKLVIAASKEESKTSSSAVRLTPTKVKILDYLATALPGLGLSLLLNNIATKQQLRRVEQLFLSSNKELKKLGQLLPTTLESFTKLAKELSSTKPEEKTIEEVEAVLFYVAE